jgi:TonB family protein
LASVERRINTRWSPPDIFRDRKNVVAVVVFPILRDGSVGPVRVVTPSGSPQFDQAAVRSVILASPFAPFPEEMKEPRMDVRFTFRLAKAGAG